MRGLGYIETSGRSLSLPMRLHNYIGKQWIRVHERILAVLLN